jgi:predicted MFS family arabinose efflux permease
MTTEKIITPDFIRSFLAQFVFSTVFCILIPAFLIYLSRFGAKEGEIGFLVGIFSVASLVLRPFVGRTLLTTPERKYMIGGTILSVISCLAYLLAPPFWPLLTVRVFHGIGMAFFSTASVTLLANMTPEAHRGRLISYYYLSYNLAFALGPYLGMVFINQFNFIFLFSACAALSLGSFYMSMKLSKRETVVTQESQPFNVYSFLSREALPPAIIGFLLNIVWGALCAFFPLYALSHGVSNPGIFFIFLAVTLMLGRSLGAKMLDIYEREKVVLPCLALVVIALIVLPFSSKLSMFILVAILLGAGWALVYPSLMIHAIEKGGSARGPAMATFSALGDLGAGLGPMIMGTVLEKTSYPVMFAGLIFTGIINLLYFYFGIMKKERKELPATEGEGK